MVSAGLASQYWGAWEPGWTAADTAPGSASHGQKSQLVFSHQVLNAHLYAHPPKIQIQQSKSYIWTPRIHVFSATHLSKISTGHQWLAQPCWKILRRAKPKSIFKSESLKEKGNRGVMQLSVVKRCHCWPEPERIAEFYTFYEIHISSFSFVICFAKFSKPVATRADVLIFLQDMQLRALSCHHHHRHLLLFCC